MKKLIAIAVVLVLSFSLIPAALVGADPGPGITGLWHFEEGSGTTTSDATGNGNTGTLKPTSSEPTWTTDSAFGTYALSFDGDNDYVEIANESNFDFDWDDPFTIEAWVKTSSDDILNIVTKMKNTAPNTGYQLIKHDNVGYDPGGDNKLYFFLIDTYNTDMIVVYGSTDITDGSYHHVVVTYDGSGTDSGVQIYVDGSPETMHTRGSWNSLSGSDSILNDLALQISGREGSNYAFDGLIDEARIWDVALTASQIALSYSGSVNWLPPVTNADFELKDGTTLPLKFQLFDNSGLVCSEQSVSLEVTGPESFTPIIFQLGEGVENLRWDADECYYIANLQTKVGNWPEGPYTATVDVDGIVIGTKTFNLSPGKGVGRGNSAK